MVDRDSATGRRLETLLGLHRETDPAAPAPMGNLGELMDSEDEDAADAARQAIWREQKRAELAARRAAEAEDTRPVSMREHALSTARIMAGSAD
jgi:hypothetical protein